MSAFLQTIQNTRPCARRAAAPSVRIFKRREHLRLASWRVEAGVGDRSGRACVWEMEAGGGLGLDARRPIEGGSCGSAWACSAVQVGARKQAQRGHIEAAIANGRCVLGCVRVCVCACGCGCGCRWLGQLFACVPACFVRLGLVPGTRFHLTQPPLPSNALCLKDGYPIATILITVRCFRKGKAKLLLSRTN